MNPASLGSREASREARGVTAGPVMIVAGNWGSFNAAYFVDAVVTFPSVYFSPPNYSHSPGCIMLYLHKFTIRKNGCITIIIRSLKFQESLHYQPTEQSSAINLSVKEWKTGKKQCKRRFLSCVLCFCYFDLPTFGSLLSHYPIIVIILYIGRQPPGKSPVITASWSHAIF